MGKSVAVFRRMQAGASHAETVEQKGRLAVELAQITLICVLSTPLGIAPALSDDVN
jgi:hypothetical protein